MMNKNDEKHKMFYNIKNDNEVYYFDERISLEEAIEQLIHFMNNYSYPTPLQELEELKTEDRRLCNVISDLHSDIRNYNEKIKKQEKIINIQWDIITSLMKLKGAIE